MSNWLIDDIIRYHLCRGRLMIFHCVMFNNLSRLGTHFLSKLFTYFSDGFFALTFKHSDTLCFWIVGTMFFKLNLTLLSINNVYHGNTVSICDIFTLFLNKKNNDIVKFVIIIFITSILTTHIGPSTVLHSSSTPTLQTSSSTFLH